MYVCDAEWQRSNIDTGEVDFCAIKLVDFVVFRKSFSVTDFRDEVGQGIGSIAEQSAHSVIVVQAAAFVVLTKWNLGTPLPSELRQALGVRVL